MAKPIYLAPKIAERRLSQLDFIVDRKTDFYNRPWLHYRRKGVEGRMRVWSGGVRCDDIRLIERRYQRL